MGQIATTHTKPERNDKSNYDDDSKHEIDNETNIKEQQQKREERIYDVLTIKNLDKRANEKIIQTIINRKLCQNVGDDDALRLQLQISLKAVSILCIDKTIKIAKIQLKRTKSKGLAAKIVQLLDGKKLFGNVLKCELVI